MRKAFPTVVAFIWAVGSHHALAGDAVAGKSKSAVCVACHGMTGVSAQDEWPTLAAQRTGYLIKQLKAFRDGTRKDPSMEPIAKGLSDSDIDDLAAYFAQLAHLAPPRS